MRALLALTAAFCLSFQSASAFGAHLYVSPEGLDNSSEGNGTTATRPLQTLQFAAERARPGDTVFAMNGVYRNREYGKSKTNRVPVLNIRNSGLADAPIMFRNYPGHHPGIEFDSGHAVYGGGVSYIVIDGFTIKGPAGAIALEGALSHRTDQPPLQYYTACGIAFKEAHHIVVRNCAISYCCGYGVRFQSCDYILAEGNEVFRNTAYHPAATCALVVMTPKSIDDSDAAKIVIRRNVVYDNVNKIPFYNPNGWPIGPEGFGGADFNEIIDGHGILVFDLPADRQTRAWKHGRVLVENNLCFGNGFNGVKLSRHRGADVVGNICTENGVSAKQQGKLTGAVGIFTTDSEDIEIRGNIVCGRGGETWSILPTKSRNVRIEDNLVFDGRVPKGSTRPIEMKPGFVNPSTDWSEADFGLQPSSAFGQSELLSNVPSSKEHLEELRKSSMAIDWIAYPKEAR